MPMILLVVVGSLNQSNSVGLCESTWGSMRGLFKEVVGKKSGFYVN